MTLTAEAEVIVAASPRTVLEFVVDLDQYRQVDPKIVRVVSVDGPDESGRGSIKIWARMRGLPPAPDRQNFLLERWERITFTGASGQPARLIFDFIGIVECQSVGDRTKVVHRYEFKFRGPFRILERALSSWLQGQIEDEMNDLSSFLKV